VLHVSAYAAYCKQTSTPLKPLTKHASIVSREVVNYSQYRKLSSIFEMQQTKSYTKLQPNPHSDSVYRTKHPKTLSVEWYLGNCCLNSL